MNESDDKYECQLVEIAILVNFCSLRVNSFKNHFSFGQENKDFGIYNEEIIDVSILTLEEEESIRSCESEKTRDFNVVYMGNFRNGKNTKFHNIHGGARMSYREYHNLKKGYFIQHTDKSKPRDPRSNNTKTLQK